MPDELPPLSSDPNVLFLHVLEQRWRLRALDQWREESDRRVSVLESQVLSEVEARKLREALAANTASQGRLRLTRAQQIGGLLVGLSALADLIRGFTGHG